MPFSIGHKYSVDAFRDVLHAVHQPLKNKNHGTLYSNIYDLANGKIYLYLLHDFEQVKVLDMKEEFAKGLHSVRLNDFFPPSQRESELRSRYEHRKRAAYRRAVRALAEPVEESPPDGRPVLKLDLDGDTNDSSGHERHGEAMDVLACEDRHGRPGKAMRFSGTSSITIPSHNDLHLSSRDFTISFWTNPDAYETGGHEVILNIFEPQSLDYSLAIVRGRVHMYFTGKNANLLLPDTIESQKWTHIAIRQDVSTFRLSIYRNGREILSTMLHSTPKKNDSPLYLGGSRIARRSGFYGALDDLVIYRRALSNEEIAALAAQ